MYELPSGQKENNFSCQGIDIHFQFSGILVFIGMFGAFFHADKTIRRQVALKVGMSLIISNM